MALLSIPESICPHPLRLVGLVQQVARLVHPKVVLLSPPAPLELKVFLLRPVPVCNEDIVAGMSPASAQHGGSEQ